MKIRQAKIKDIPKLSKLIAEIINATPYYSKKARFEEAKKHNRSSLTEYFNDGKYYICFIAEEAKNIIGFITGRNEAVVFWADWLGVDKKFRCKGIGETLMKKLESDISKKGMHKIWCDTRMVNKESTALLKKLKYLKLGSFKNGWHKQDFFLWEKDLV